MKKLLEINKCIECPYFMSKKAFHCEYSDEREDLDIYSAFCNNKCQSLLMKDSRSLMSEDDLENLDIPDWCPL